MQSFIKSFLYFFMLLFLISYTVADTMSFISGQVEKPLLKIGDEIQNHVAFNIFVVCAFIYFLFWWIRMRKDKRLYRTETEVLRKGVCYLLPPVLLIVAISLFMRFLDLSLYAYYVNVIIIFCFVAGYYILHKNRKRKNNVSE